MCGGFWLGSVFTAGGRFHGAFRPKAFDSLITPPLLETKAQAAGTSHSFYSNFSLFRIKAFYGILFL
jgi:hypothetical protein